MTENQRCKGCGAEILWFKMVSGKRMPVDPKPEQRIMVLEDLPEGTVSNFNSDLGAMVKVYTQHWATCPKAKDFKKEKD